MIPEIRMVSSLFFLPNEKDSFWKEERRMFALEKGWHIFTPSSLSLDFLFHFVGSKQRRSREFGMKRGLLNGKSEDFALRNGAKKW